MTAKEALDLAKYAMITDMDRDCENPTRNCFNCKHHTKCKVMTIKEALCHIENNARSMSNEQFVKLKNWAIEYYQKNGGT